MNEQTLELLQQIEQTTRTVREEISARLADQPLTDERLAAVLQPYFPEKTQEDLISDVQLLRAGIEAGAQQFDELDQCSDEQLQGRFGPALERCLSEMDEKQQRQYLLTLAQVILQDEKLSVSDRMAMYLAHLELPDLKLRVADLLKEASCRSVKEVLEVMHQTGRSVREAQDEDAAEASARTDEEQDLMEAAVFYAANRVIDGQVEHVEQLGRKVGFMRRVFNTAMRWMKLNWSALLARLVLICAVGAAALLLWEVLALLGGTAVVVEGFAMFCGKHVLTAGAMFLARWAQRQLIDPFLENFPFESVRMEAAFRLNGIETLYLWLQCEAEEYVDEDGTLRVDHSMRMSAAQRRRERDQQVIREQQEDTAAVREGGLHVKHEF